MARLFGRTYTRAELSTHVGDVSQVGGVQLAELTDGRAHGLRVAQVRTGSGLDYQVLVDRALDLGVVSFNGAPLTWLSAAGFASPYYYEPEGQAWIRTFGGGLLVTCGLTQVGDPTVDGDETMGIHGRISNLPASRVAVGGEWEGDEYEFWVQGDVVQSILYGESLRLRRRISGRLGEPVIRLRDTVTNMGWQRTPLMVLYHCNFGHPLLAEGTELLAKPHKVVGKSEADTPHLPDVGRVAGPTPGWPSQVFFHEPVADGDGWATVAVVNRRFNNGQGLGVEMRWPLAAMPVLNHWKQVGQVDYLMGVEPGNCHVNGRVWERNNGTLQYIEPGETREFAVDFRVLPDNRAIDALRL